MLRVFLRSVCAVSLFLLTPLLMLAPVQAQAEPVALKDLFRNAEFGGVTLSPDGKHIAVALPEGDRTSLVVLEVADKKAKGRWDYGANRHIGGVRWVSNERFMFSVSSKLGSLDFQQTSPDLYASNIDGSKRIDIPNGNVYQILGRVKGEDNVVWAQRSIDQAFLFKIDTLTGKVRTVGTAPLDFGSFVLDQSDEIRYAIGRMKDNRMRTLRREGSEWKLIGETEMGGDGLLVPLMFAPDNQRVYMQGSRDGKPAVTVLLDAETGKEEVVSANPISDPRGMLTSGDGSTLLAIEYLPGQPEYQIIAPTHPEARAIAGLIAAFPNASLRFGNASQDGRLRVFYVYSDTDPGTYYLFDSQRGTATFLLSSRRWIKPEQMSRAKPVQFAARDGLDIHGYLTLPKDREAKKLPMVVFVHGGPHGPRDVWGFDPHVQAMASRGYAVLQINFRGSGGYGPAFERAGYRKWGREMQDDLTDGVRWVIDQGYADADRICIYGGSYGGYAALMSPIREPELYRCAIGYVGVYSLPMMFDKGDIPRSTPGRAFQRRVLPETEEEQKAQSPAFNVDKLDIPVMFVHGAKDERVPIEQMNFMIKEMERRGKKPEDVLVERNEGHGFQLPENNVKLYERVFAFLDRHTAPR